MTELNTPSRKIGFSTNIISFVALVGFFVLILPIPDVVYMVMVQFCLH